ncbi:MAG TPA: ester cyclase, partial [Acidobacteriota bacterium]|nr:ester cyclase [Acidobacteriota bacterium]
LEIRSRDELIRFLRDEFMTFPDGQETLLDLFADGDRVAARHRFAGTQKGPLGSLPPSNKTLSAEYLAVYRLESGRIVEAWVEWDNLNSLKQLGHIPPGMI